MGKAGAPAFELMQTSCSIHSPLLRPRFNVLPALPAAPAVPAVQVKERATKAQPVVKQAKILLDEERPGPDGAPRSKSRSSSATLTSRRPCSTMVSRYLPVGSGRHGST